MPLTLPQLERHLVKDADSEDVIRLEMEGGTTAAEVRLSAENVRWYRKEGSFWVPPRSRHETLINDAHQNVGDQLNKALTGTETANTSLYDVLEQIDFTRKVGQSKIPDNKLRQPITYFGTYRLRNEDFEFPDLLGAAYEYLIGKFADSAGKKGGELMHFDRVLTNPPFSIHWGNTEKNADGTPAWAPKFPARFRYGQVPLGAREADLMFLQHMLAVTRDGGMVATVMPHGVLFRCGEEKTIRAGQIDDDLLEAATGVAPDLFYGTSIPACMLVLRQPVQNGANRVGGKPTERQGKVLFINADREFFEERAQNHLLPGHLVPASLGGANIARQPALVRLADQTLSAGVMHDLTSTGGKRQVLGQSLGSAQQVVNLGDLRRVRIPSPTRKEQVAISRRIDGILERLDQEVGELSKLLRRKSGLMDDLLTGRVRVTSLLEAATP